MIKTSLLAAISQWQIERGQKFTIPDLAERTGLSQNFLYRFNRGEIKLLDLEKLGQLCIFFGCTPDDLLWQEGDPRARSVIGC